MWKQIHRQTLFLRFRDRLAAADVKENLSLRQPICPLLQISGQLDISLAQYPSDELIAQRRRIVKEEKRLSSTTRNSWIKTAQFALPFRLQQIPPGLDLLRVEQLGIIGTAPRPNLAGNDDRGLVLGVGEVQFSVPPGRCIVNFRQNKQRLQRLQRPGRERGVTRRSSHDKIRKVFPSPSFRDDPLGVLRSFAANEVEFDFR